MTGFTSKRLMSKARIVLEYDRQEAVNEAIQWAGTACFMVMYVLMSFFKELHPWNIVAGALGSALYLAWAYRVANKPQVITNVVGLTLLLVGLYNALG